VYALNIIATTFFTDCGKPNVTDFVHVNVNGTTFNQTATYFCEHGYETRNETTAVCEDSGEWSIEPPVCSGMFSFRASSLFAYSYNSVISS